MEIKDGIKVFDNPMECISTVNREDGILEEGEYYIVQERVIITTDPDSASSMPLCTIFWAEQAHRENFGGFFKIERALEYIKFSREHEGRSSG